MWRGKSLKLFLFRLVHLWFWEHLVHCRHSPWVLSTSPTLTLPYPSYPGPTPPLDKPTSWKVAWPSPAKWLNTTCVWTWVSRSDSMVIVTIVGDVCARDWGQWQCCDQLGGDQLCSASTIIHIAHARQKPMMKHSMMVNGTESCQMAQSPES